MLEQRKIARVIMLPMEEEFSLLLEEGTLENLQLNTHTKRQKK